MFPCVKLHKEYVSFKQLWAAVIHCRNAAFLPSQDSQRCITLYPPDATWKLHHHTPSSTWYRHLLANCTIEDHWKDLAVLQQAEMMQFCKSSKGSSSSGSLQQPAASLDPVCTGVSYLVIQGIGSCPDPSHLLTPHPLSVSPSLHITCILSPDPYSSPHPPLLTPSVSVNKTSTVLLCPQVEHSFHYSHMLHIQRRPITEENLGYLCTHLHKSDL